VIKFCSHLNTVCKHKWFVFLACKDLGILWRGIKHDMSKFLPVEFIPGVRYFQGNKSPIVAERIDKGYSIGWQHHKGHNTHHWEYWLDITENGLIPIKMPYKDVLELICDRVGATKTYCQDNWDKSMPYEYWDRNKDKVIIHQDTFIFIEESLEYIKTYGWGLYKTALRFKMWEY
jgi:hypothetical protein